MIAELMLRELMIAEPSDRRARRTPAHGGGTASVGAVTTPERPPLDLSALRAALSEGPRVPAAAGAGEWRVRVVEETGSTNDDLAAAARRGEAAPGDVLVADLQTAGRGRLGRRWQAPARSSLAVSVLVEPDVRRERWGWLPLLTGVAVATAVERVSGVTATLKWPNDVRVGERKLAGLLAEAVPDAAGTPHAVVLGIGLNTTLTEAERPVPEATSLLLEGATVNDRTPVLAEVLRRLAAQLTAFTQAGGDAAAAGLADAYAARCATLGTHVRVELPGGQAREGVADRIDEDGRLVVGGEPVSAGDVTSLR
jgi:BirA family biotin operon repressor/biotin-[acetyl-CoA-carboxylase] ligase